MPPESLVIPYTIPLDLVQTWVNEHPELHQEILLHCLTSSTNGHAGPNGQHPTPEKEAHAPAPASSAGAP